jgi:hypothetical protein
MHQWALHMNHYMVNSCEYYAKVKMSRGSVILARNDHMSAATRPPAVAVTWLPHVALRAGARGPTLDRATASGTASTTAS